MNGRVYCTIDGFILIAEVMNMLMQAEIKSGRVCVIWSLPVTLGLKGRSNAV